MLWGRFSRSVRKSRWIHCGSGKQIDRLIGKVSAKMEEIEVSMKEDVADGKRLNEEKAKELKDSLAQIEEQLTTAKQKSPRKYIQKM